MESERIIGWCIVLRRSDREADMGIDASNVRSLIYARIPYNMGSFSRLFEINRLFLLSARMLELIHPGARGRRGCRSGTILTILYLCTEYLRTGSGEFPLWRRCGRFHYGEPYFWNNCFHWSMYT